MVMESELGLDMDMLTQRSAMDARFSPPSKLKRLNPYQAASCQFRSPPVNTRSQCLASRQTSRTPTNGLDVSPVRQNQGRRCKQTTALEQTSRLSPILSGSVQTCSRTRSGSQSPFLRKVNVRAAFKPPAVQRTVSPTVPVISVPTPLPLRSIASTLMNVFRNNSTRRTEPNRAGRTLWELSKERAVEDAMLEAACIQDVDSQFGCSTFHGLPLVVKDLIKKYKGIDCLYDWQNECLNLTAVQNKTNLIYCLPTSGGKTLVAEILIWKEILCYKKNALFVLPYVSIVQQKINDMSEIAIELGFFLEEYAGSKGQIPPRKHHQKPCIYIATIEKASMLINCFFEENRMKELGLVVVDELHMVGENGGRGAVLENMLTKLLFCPNGPMICGMSATIGNINDLKRFLNAEVYQRDFRPVELFEFVKLGNCIYSLNKGAKYDEDLVTLSRTLSFQNYSKAMMKEDKDCLAGLIEEVIPQHSCLVFCPTKSNCENVARLVCKTMDKTIKQVKQSEKNELLNTLTLEGNGELCHILRATIPYGVAYHHSGLTMDERLLLEQAYSAGVLCCLTCTSTLAAGVNLPAKRVIIRSPYIGKDLITLSRLKQMTGRAGRTGIDSSGESILIVQQEDEKKVGKLLREPIEQCKSTLLDNSRGLAMLLLSAIGLKIVSTNDDIRLLVSKTLLHIQKPETSSDTLEMHVKSALNSLKELNLINAVKPAPVSNTGYKNNRNGSLIWEVTKLGKATFKGSIDLDWTKVLYSDLTIGLSSLVLNTHLHLLYLVTPYNLVDSICPIADVYFSSYNKLTQEDMHVAQVIGVTNVCVVNIMNGVTNRKPSPQVIKRFYATLILYDLWKQKTIWQVAEKFRLPRGQVQNLLSSAASFATCTMNFCKELSDLWAYNSLFPNFIQQLSHCVTAELVPLMDLPLTNRARARQLYSAGFKTIAILSQAEPDDLVRKIDHMPRSVARKLVGAAKVLILKKAEELQDEVEDLFAIESNS